MLTLYCTGFIYSFPDNPDFGFLRLYLKYQIDKVVFPKFFGLIKFILCIVEIYISDFSWLFRTGVYGSIQALQENTDKVCSKHYSKSL